MWTSSDPSSRARHAENDQLLRVLPQKLIERETRRAPYRWAGYQFMSPLECTRQFARDYCAQFRLAFYGACHFEPEVGSAEFETLWEMRLAADDCLMSYPMYLAIAFHIFRRRDVELFRRPHMLFARFQEKPTWNKQVAQAYEENGPRQRSKVAAMGHYQRKSYCGLPAQDSFRSGIRKAAKQNGWRRTTEMYVLQFPVLSPADLVSEISGAERIEAIAEMQAGRCAISRIAERVAPENLLQTCFAWPRRKSLQGRCSVCPQEEACGAGHSG